MPESPREVAAENMHIGLNAVVDLVDDLRRQIDKLVEPEANNETLFCTICGAKAVGLGKSLRTGWSCIIDDEGNDEGNFAGHCGGCTEKLADEEDDELERRSSPRGIPTEPKQTLKTPGTLFDLSPERP